MQGFEEWLWAFFELSNDRQIGMAAGPIPSGSITAWIEAQGMSHDDGIRFRSCIRGMDQVYLGQVKPDKPKPPEVTMGPELFMAKFGKT